MNCAAPERFTVRVTRYTLSTVVAWSAACALLVCGCQGNAGVSSVAGATDTLGLCPNVTGPLAIQYDVQSGIPTAALTTVPVIETYGGTFGYPGYPLLGFDYPSGWTPQAFGDATSFGVNLVRDDGQAEWRWITAQVALGTTSTALRDAEVNLLFQAFGGATFDTVCSNDSPSTPAPGVNAQATSTIIQFNGFTAVIATSTVFVDGLFAGTAFATVAVGPTSEMDTLIMNTFLPIHFQLLVGPESIQDSDGDQVPDTTDDFPFDPTRQ